MPVYQPNPQTWPPTYPLPTRPAAPPVAVRPQARPAPVVRGQQADEPRSLPDMPTPAQLGVSLPKPADWTELRVRLDRLGASQFSLSQRGDGWRFACRLPGGRPLEAHGATEADAVVNALNQCK